MPQSPSTSSLVVSSAASAIALTVLAVAATHHVPVAHAGRALPSSYGTRGAPAQLQSQSQRADTAAAAATTGWLLDAFRPRALKEDDNKNKDKNKDARDDMGDDCWGWKEGWDDDEYEPCWDGTFKYELDPETPPDRCDKWEPGDDTDDWTEVCEDWYDTYFCAADDEKAQKCGGKGKDTPLACCEGFVCGDDDKCVPLPTCAAPGTEAVGCGGAKGQSAEACCEGLECSADGDETCVVPAPPSEGKMLTAFLLLRMVGTFHIRVAKELTQILPLDPHSTQIFSTDCVNADFAFVYEAQAGLESAVTCADIALDDGQCDSAIAGRPELTVAAYCSEICREECTTNSPTAAPVDDVSESAIDSEPTASEDVAADTEISQSLIPFQTAIELLVPNISRMRRRAQENRAPVSVDEEEIERIASERIDEALAELGGGYASSTVNMKRVGEYAVPKSDFTVLTYSLTGVARFVGPGTSKLPSRLEVDAAVLDAFEGVSLRHLSRNRKIQ